MTASRQKSFKFKPEAEGKLTVSQDSGSPKKKPASPGKCALCGGIFSKGAMGRHIASCSLRKASPKALTAAFHLVVEGGYRGAYWLHLAVPSETPLLDLDNFLRGIWLECCGHMSAFSIQDTQFTPQVSADLGARSMSVPLGRVLTVGAQFSYEYDFGSTTELRLKVAGMREIAARPAGVRLMAQNEPPEITCERCGPGILATQICSNCVWDDRGWLCDNCAEAHPCGEEVLLPVVNSPRVGVCAYAG